jgi:uncharacterized protein YneF (UPF0154 family)
MKEKIIVVIVGILLVVGAFFAGNWLSQRQKADLQPIPKITVKTPQDAQEKAGATAAAPGQADEAARIPIAERYTDKSFDELEQELSLLCRDLDQKDYIAAYKIDGGTFAHFNAILKRLADRPPEVTGETRNMYTLLSNISHFYRQMGLKNITLTKDILAREGERIEPAMALLYAYLNQGIASGKLNLKLINLYEYAGFFLNTLGGRAYLLRRDSRTRILTTYYSILILDRANQKGLNRHGLDILPPLELLMDDLRNYRELKGSDQYLAALSDIRDKLKSQRG